ncbi:MULTISPECIES: hypothetical protein [unclassified Spirillospora]|uniref:hypothetical protein n=1 Tax=unclassified Spirillospora TaxID=2642701 RepID=UPI003719FE28
MFGEDASAIRVAIEAALAETQEAMRDSHTAGRSSKKFTAGSSRMTNQFERLVEQIVALDIEGTEQVSVDGVFYELALVHNVLLYPYQIDLKKGAEPGDRWPKPKLSRVIRELFKLTEPQQGQWVEDTFEGMEVPGIELRRTLAELALRAPRPSLVLIPYAMNLSGLQRAWWGQATLLDEAGHMRWITECSELATAPITLSEAAQQGSDQDGFSSGDVPSITMSARSEADRHGKVPPRTESEDDQADAVERDED